MKKNNEPRLIYDTDFIEEWELPNGILVIDKETGKMISWEGKNTFKSSSQ